ncbi:MAG TPA: zinc ribbon domain-containing protein [Polyangiaceae bacterium]|jgi:hypothetical protein|nr:zinc ribbon domain-containing protein [Polyangiaceae bacterium]
MPLIQFVQNYEDLSTDHGYQFKFFCDKCHNGFMTHFQASTIGMAESALKVAGNLFGGFFNTASNSAYEIQRAVGGPAHDAALEAAVKEGKQHFHQCTRCGKWVCPDVCWNNDAGLCEGCAPNLQEELASAAAQAKADAARAQLREKAAKTDYVGDIDMSANAVLRAPGPATAAGDRCTGCGAALGGARFCPQCGTPRPAPGCPGCGAAIAPNTRFCASCGHKLA